MNRFKELIISSMLVAGLSLAVSAQKNDDQKKPPPKDPPPKVEPGRPDKPPPKNPPRDPKKPGSGYALVWRDESIFLA